MLNSSNPKIIVFVTATGLQNCSTHTHVHVRCLEVNTSWGCGAHTGRLETRPGASVAHGVPASPPHPPLRFPASQTRGQRGPAPPPGHLALRHGDQVVSTGISPAALTVLSQRPHNSGVWLPFKFHTHPVSGMRRVPSREGRGDQTFE